MKFTVLTIFPEMFAPLKESILKRAQEAGLLEIALVNFRDYAESKHKNVDDIPYGGGSGMVLKPEPLFKAVRNLPEPAGSRRIILLTPQGKKFDQREASRLAGYDELIFLCGHYEGFDERIRTLADEEMSIGDYVLTGGELAAMVMIDSVARLLPGVLGNNVSQQDDSHSQGLLEYPQYTRPPDFDGMQVPDVLLSGHHANIERWRRKESLRKTFLKRSDLVPQIEFQQTDYPLLEELVLEHPEINVYRERWEHLKPAPKRRRRIKSE
ncbi:MULTISPECIES: tRNA (guanosine(37)-N1)-methyltransferase TrmD [unclassified Dehalobacter]|uniref:tRNA (guanosine(37)-N1)-methyltransferase TrmD n=1 Tax=unclassified Dehalobacter TaxID=2635733 RepID=UPI000E6B7AF0|nr:MULTISPECIES: tRNA (guanosine(37)-N1)-methyltransferase TrmD [unclassified Dehalobacter]RJE49198.1 tRNA (guanosine(37)-N1)-methyltransferase TrmD [Dehalobacter sp. MCB1]TCX53239.1 tRNA (guanosine(37)-N1)-methyltransferase TrmD [Dehalobacter sp. 14DCB1]TCX54253.1 tRNA (guanosine(37)-N1)-methyltransferase TrmD [Dehalobacter sp. 12DCB1]